MVVDLVDFKVPKALLKKKRVMPVPFTPPSLKPRLFPIYLQKYKQMHENPYSKESRCTRTFRQQKQLNIPVGLGSC